MELVVVWSMKPRADRVAEFEERYGPNGQWAALFRTAPGYLGTELLRPTADANSYLVIDRWASAAAYETFRTERQAEYAALDGECEALTDFEEKIGEFDTVG